MNQSRLLTVSIVLTLALGIGAIAGVIGSGKGE